MIRKPRVATPQDFEACVRLRSVWLERFRGAHSPEERWCPAGVPVPYIENEKRLRRYLAPGESDRWAAVLTTQGEADAYALCRNDKDKSELWIERHTPRVSSRLQLDEAGSKLLEFVIRLAAEQGIKRVRVFFHGFPDEVDPLISLYQKNGFELGKGNPRREMLSRQLLVNPGPHHLQFRSAEEIGLDAFYESEAVAGHCPSAEEAKKDCEISRRMWWSVEPATDWLVAYEGQNVVGTVRVAVTRDGVGVLDNIAIAKEYRGRGLGICLLARGLSSLVGRTEVVWLDVDHDNVPALRLYRRAGFRVHHHHCGMALKMTSV